MCLIYDFTILLRTVNAYLEIYQADFFIRVSRNLEFQR